MDIAAETRRVFVTDYQLERGGHVVELWSDDDRLSYGECSCGQWGARRLHDAEMVLSSWRCHVGEVTA